MKTVVYRLQTTKSKFWCFENYIFAKIQSKHVGQLCLKVKLQE
jgi:hypothetical protein